MGCINSHEEKEFSNSKLYAVSPEVYSGYQNSISREEMAKIHVKRVEKSNKYEATISNHYERNLKRKQSKEDKRQEKIVADWMT